MPKNWRESEAASNWSMSPRSSPHHSSSPDGSTSRAILTRICRRIPRSCCPTNTNSLTLPAYSWLLDRPPRLSPHLPASLYESASPHPSSPGLSEIPLQGWYRIYHHFGKFHRGGTMARVAPDDTTITGSSVVARVGTSPSPFKFRVIGDAIISVTYGLGSDNDQDLFPAGPVYAIRCRRRFDIPTSRCLHYIRRRQAGRGLRTIFRHLTGGCLRKIQCWRGRRHHTISPPSSPPSTETVLDNADFLNENMIKKTHD